MTALNLRTARISQLPPATLLTGNELVEMVQTGVNSKATTRAFVLPFDPLLTLAAVGGTLSGSRQLVAGTGISLTDNGPGNTLVISATGGGGGGGVTDHGALTGLLDDDHPQYLTAARGDALFLTPGEGDVRYAAAGSGITDHGLLTGLGDDDHPQYLNNARGDARYDPIGAAAAVVVAKITRGAAWLMSDGSALVLPISDVQGVRVPQNCTVAKVSLFTQGGTGSCVVDVRKDNYGAYPPTSGDSICASAKPTISGGIKYEDAVLTGWSKNLLAGDVLGFAVVSTSVFTNIVIQLDLVPT